MTNTTPDVRILVGNLGDASPSGASANLIRNNLQAALSASPVKARIIVDVTGSDASAASIRAVSQATAQLTNARQADAAAAQRQNAAQAQNIKATQQSASASLAAAKATAKAADMRAKFTKYLTTVKPKALTQFSTEINTINTLLGQGTADAVKQASIHLTSLKAAIETAGYAGGNAITFLGSKLKSFGAYLVSSALTMAIVNGVRTMIDNVKDLDAALTDLRIVTGATRKETEELLSTYNKMAQRIGSTTSDVASSATSWMRQGYGLEDTDTLIETSMIFSKVGFLEADEAASALTSTIKGYKLAVEDAMSAVDTFTTLDLDLATSAGEIATALAETASSAETAGISLEKAAAQIGIVLEVTQASGEEIGNFYKTLMARLSNIKAGRLEDPETGESLNTWGIAA